MALPARLGPDDPSDLAGVVGHELRTPLTGLLGMLDLVTDPTSPLLEEERSELLAVAHQEAWKMSRLVENLLLQAKLSRGALSPRPEPVGVAQVVRDALAANPEVAKRALVSVTEDDWAWADPHLLRQILANLIQNVDRYAPTGEMEIGSHREGERISITVSDDGPGITRFPATVKGLPGLGIGLALSRSLAEEMGGRLEIVSPLRAGTTFLLSLPAAQAQPGSALAALPNSGGAGVRSPRMGLLADLTEALAERSLERAAVGLEGLARDLLSASYLLLAVPAGRRSVVAGGTGSRLRGVTVPALPPEGLFEFIDQVAGHPGWGFLAGAGISSAAVVPIPGHGRRGAVVIGWAQTRSIPLKHLGEIGHALARLAAVAIDRSRLAEELDAERRLRAAVMEALPLAVSVFAGDPIEIVDWNQAERRLLGIVSDGERPSDLDASQRMFEVRFADGSPLTPDNAPAALAIREGRGAGPFLLRVRRKDGTEVITRTHCAPYFGPDGKVAGAVVTSEELAAGSVQAASDGVSPRGGGMVEGDLGRAEGDGLPTESPDPSGGQS
jgi:PAS domain-containing protein